ncbi:VWA domain-containing protein [Shewanella sp. D64]|uniref:VWA domain-containing protein n=1 Tax=unclassified Shewanella TaxID=196818 RepID=UPI0022BA6879|nr:MULTISPECIES: VWA domain-containing protein [unclassified Shewanella]MEC4728904.1 VWA domain-containing protein [Shewanella sp. D64]MEC4740778.1 VWA domain-containing protein [Shewanella sp. E94]WBJ97386.1 VWA domain-containing protein [Shewanella sp. MTB7]
MLHFLRPEWFFALLPLLIILILIWKSERLNSNWSHYISPHLANFLVSKSQQVKRSNLGYLAVSWFIAVLALSGPAISKQSLPVYEAAQGRVIIMDMSLSMYATDLSPNRLTQAKFKATDLIEALTEGETGLIAYAGDAFTISPLTRDRATLLNLLPTLSPDIMPVRGSNLPAALAQGKSLLTQGGHIRGDIILLTDGVSTNQINAAKKVLQGTQYRLSILALGSKQGSPIRLPGGQLLRDRSDQVVIAKTDYSQLNELTQSADGILVPFRSDGADLQQLTSWLDTSGDTKATELNGEVWQDAGPYIALLLLLPVLLSFRHGLVASILVFAIYQPSPVEASTWDDLWKTKDQQGMQAYKTQDYTNASTTFTSPQWQASAHYKAGEYDEALSLFEQDSSAFGLYNQGNALMQKGEFEEAAKRYSSALELDPNLEGAEDNHQLAEKLAQQKQDKPESDSDKSDNSDKNEDSDQKDKDDKQNQDQQSDQNKESEQDKGKDQDQQSDQEQGSEQNSKEQQQNSEQSDSDQNEQQSSQEQDNEAEMQADPNQKQDEPQNADDQPKQSPEAQQTAKAEEEKNAAQEQTAEAQAPQQNQDENQADGNEQQAQTAQAVSGPEDLTPEMERAMRGLVDDPQVLLRNKMQLEYQKRRMQGLTSKEHEQW